MQISLILVSRFFNSAHMRFFFWSVSLTFQQQTNLWKFIVCFSYGYALFPVCAFFLHFMPELIYFLFTFHCLCFLFEEEKIGFYWKFNAFSSSFPIQCVISIVATSLLIYVSISLSLSVSLLNRFVCGFGIVSLLWARTVKILLLLLSNALYVHFFHHFIN